MEHTTGILMGLFLVFVAAQVGAEIAQRLKMPAVVGEIVAGCLIGPSVLGWVHPSEPLEVLAEIGAVLLLFSVGLETRVEGLKKIGWIAASVGALGVIAPFALAVVWAEWAGFTAPHAMFVAAAFVATSAGITARVLQELGALNRLESRVILGAAVIDDILAMLLLGVVTALQRGGSVQFASLALVLAQAVGFIALVTLVGTHIARKAHALLDAPISPLSPLTLSLALCLGLAVASAYLGLAAIIGAFLAGMVLAETPHRGLLERQVPVVMAVLVPFFFVVTGMKVELSSLASWGALGTLALVTALAVIGKLSGGGLGALPLGRRSALLVGVGMVPRGEVGIIVASLGQQAGAFSGATYGIIVAMSLLTSILAPPVLKILLAHAPIRDMDAGSVDASPLVDVEETGHASHRQRRRGPAAGAEGDPPM